MKFWSVLFIFVLSLPLVAQDTEKITWDKTRLLKWEDFKASPKKHLPYKANTNSGLSFSWNATESRARPYLIMKLEVIFTQSAPGLRKLKK